MPPVIPNRPGHHDRSLRRLHPQSATTTGGSGRPDQHQSSPVTVVTCSPTDQPVNGQIVGGEELRVPLAPERPASRAAPRLSVAALLDSKQNGGLGTHQLFAPFQRESLVASIQWSPDSAVWNNATLRRSATRSSPSSARAVRPRSNSDIQPPGRCPGARPPRSAAK